MKKLHLSLRKQTVEILGQRAIIGGVDQTIRISCGPGCESASPLCYVVSDAGMSKCFCPQTEKCTYETDPVLTFCLQPADSGCMCKEAFPVTGKNC